MAQHNGWDKSITFFNFFPFYTIYDDKHKNLFVLIIADKAIN